MQEAELIQQAQNGSTSCFSQLVVLYQSRLYSFLLSRCLNKADAEDVLQETLINAYKYLKSYNSQWAFSTWLFTIATRQLSQVKHKNHVPLTDLYGLDISNEDQTRIDENNMWLIIRKHLDVQAYDLLWFFYIEGQSIKEIAHILNQSESWVKTKLHRSKMKLSNIPSLQQMMTE